MKKRIALVLALLLTVTGLSCAVFAQDTPTITVGTVNGYMGRTVDVPIFVSGNPGVIAMDFSVTYDASVLTLQKVTNGVVFDDTAALFGNDFSANPFTLLWVDELTRTNYTGNGVVATLTFAVAPGWEELPTGISVALVPDSTFNVDLNDVHFDVESGTVNMVFPPPSHDLTFHTCDDAYTPTLDVYRRDEDTTFIIPGSAQVENDCYQTAVWVDVTHGGLYAAGDPFVVTGDTEFYLLGDVNGDGAIDASDVTRLSRLLVGLIDIEDVANGTGGVIWQACNIVGYDADFDLAADLDSWEDYIDASDVTILSRYLVGLNVQFKS